MKTQLVVAVLLQNLSACESSSALDQIEPVADEAVKPLPVIQEPVTQSATEAAVWIEPRDGVSAFADHQVRVGLRLPRAQREDAVARLSKAVRLVTWPEEAPVAARVTTMVGDAESADSFVTLSVEGDLAARQYAVVVDRAQFVLHADLESTAMLGSRIVSRFDVASNPRVVRMRSCAGEAGSFVTLELSEPVVLDADHLVTTSGERCVRRSVEAVPGKSTAVATEHAVFDCPASVTGFERVQIPGFASRATPSLRVAARQVTGPSLAKVAGAACQSLTL